MIAAYGQDDRVCAYTSLIAEIENHECASFTIFADKEEIGSECVGGMQSNWWYDVLEDICKELKINVRDVCRQSICISADVDAAFDPSWADVYDETNCFNLNHGITIRKCEGGNGKYDSNDSSMKILREVINKFKKNNVKYQCGEMGKLDLMDGGTVSMYIARKNINCLDMGTPILSMHSPNELTSIFDIYETYKAYKVFYKNL